MHYEYHWLHHTIKLSDHWFACKFPVSYMEKSNSLYTNVYNLVVIWMLLLGTNKVCFAKFHGSWTIVDIAVCCIRVQRFKVKINKPYILTRHCGLNWFVVGLSIDSLPFFMHGNVMLSIVLQFHFFHTYLPYNCKKLKYLGCSKLEASHDWSAFQSTFVFPD